MHLRWGVGSPSDVSRNTYAMGGVGSKCFHICVSLVSPSPPIPNEFSWGHRPRFPQCSGPGGSAPAPPPPAARGAPAPPPGPRRARWAPPSPRGAGGPRSRQAGAGASPSRRGAETGVVGPGGGSRRARPMGMCPCARRHRGRSPAPRASKQSQQDHLDASRSCCWETMNVDVDACARWGGVDACARWCAVDVSGVVDFGVP